MESHTGHNVDENAIRAKAHELWVQRGSPKGSPELDWDQAERILRTEAQQQQVATVDQRAPGRTDRMVEEQREEVQHSSGKSGRRRV